MPQLPAGSFTFVFTDIEGSTRLWESHPEEMQQALAHHDEIVATAIGSNGGHVFATAGDSFSSAFDSAPAALGATLQIQLGIRAARLPIPVRVRAAVHTGPAERRGGDYFGPTLNRCARLLDAAHGGQVVISDDSRQAAGDLLPEGSSLRDLGPQRLRDLSTPIRAFQLIHPDLAAHFPPLRSLDSYRHNLTTQLTSFIGRVSELERCRQLLGDARLLTVTGVGGSGKSRLAIQLAAEEVDSFPDGVWLIELAATRKPQDVTQALAAVLDAEGPSIEGMVVRSIDAIGHRTVMLVFDNAEHQLDATATLIERLLRGCPNLKLIVTSREPLGIGGEVVHRLPPMAIDGVDGPAEAVQLFVDRARAARDDFVMDERNSRAIGEICRRLDGIPLAIELAAARVSAMSPEDIAARLDDRFRLLTGGRRTAVDRQQTLQAAMDWGYDLLSPMEQAVFRRLTVFRGGFTPHQAEEVCSDAAVTPADVFPAVLRLVDKSLINTVETKHGTRYRMFQTVRQYGRGKLDGAGETPEARQRHAEAFLRLAEEAEQHMRGPHESAWLRRLDPERDNFRAAMEHLMTRDDPVPALRLADALRTFLYVRGGTRESIGWLLELLDRVDESTSPLLVAETRSWSGFLLDIVGEDERGEELIKHAVASLRELDAPAALGHELMRLGYLYLGKGRLAEARDAVEEAIPLLKATEETWALAQSVGLLATLARTEGHVTTASALYGEALEIMRETGHERGIADILAAMGGLALAAGEWERSGELLEEALAIFQHVGSRDDVVATTMLLGDVEALHGDPNWAHALYTDGTLQWNRTEAPDLAPEMLASWALLARRLKKLEEAAYFWGAEAQSRGDNTRMADQERLRSHELEQLAAALDPKRLQEAWEQGAEAALDEAIALALDLDTPDQPAPGV